MPKAAKTAAPKPVDVELIAGTDTPRPVELLTSSTDYVRQATEIVVAGRPAAEQATDLVKWIKTTAKKAEEERKRWVQPLNDTVARINAEFRKITDPLNAAELKIKSKLLAFRQAEERAAEVERQRLREQEEQALAAAENASERGEDDVAEQIVAAVVAVPEPVAPGPVRGDMGAIGSVVRRWTFRVLDAKLVPAQYLMVNEAAIKAAIKGGERVIPGVEIYQDESVSIR